MKKVLGNAVLVVLGLTVALGLIEILLRTYPNVVPPGVRVNPPARRVMALMDETYELRLSDGDLFHHMQGKVLPLSPDLDQLIASIHLVTDAYGFRNSPPEKSAYSVVAVGDSFTRGNNVASPWPQVLAEYSGKDVFNLGEGGFGPQDELKVLRQYGLEKQPQWVILGYFEGNDLYDAGSYQQANPFILLRLGRYIYGETTNARQHSESDDNRVHPTPTYLYPIPVNINEKQFDLVFFSPYISWLSLSEETLAASQNYHLVKETILQMNELCQETHARLLLVYIPSKEHIYLPYLDESENAAKVFTDVLGIELEQTGFLQFGKERVAPEFIYQHMDDQSHLMAEFAEEQQIGFINLTSVFQQEASAGAELYYTFDTHWNQLGHDLAAQAIYDYLKTHPTTVK